MLQFLAYAKYSNWYLSVEVIVLISMIITIPYLFSLIHTSKRLLYKYLLKLSITKTLFFIYKTLPIMDKTVPQRKLLNWCPNQCDLI